MLVQNIVRAAFTFAVQPLIISRLGVIRCTQVGMLVLGKVSGRFTRYMSDRDIRGGGSFDLRPCRRQIGGGHVRPGVIAGDGRRRRLHHVHHAGQQLDRPRS